MEGTVAMDKGISSSQQTITSTGTTTGVAGSTVTSTGTATTTSGIFDRDTFVGVANASMGTVVLGQHDTPYKMATRGLDVFADSAADNRAMMSGHDLRLSNVIAYISPSFSGLTLAYASVFGAESAGYTAGVKDIKGSAHSLAAMYTMDAIYGTFAYQTVTVGTAGSGDLGGLFGLGAEDKISAFKLGGGYKMDQIAVNAIYESATMTPLGGTANKNANLYLAGKFGISATDAVKAAYTKHGATKAGSVTATDDMSQIAIGYDHDMSKATQVYALYTKVSTNSAVNVNPSTLSFGIKHSF
jgi:predicted porin